MDYTIEEEIKPGPIPDDIAIVSREAWEADEPAKRLIEHVHPLKHVWYIYNIGAPFCKTKDDCKRIVKLLQKRCITMMEMHDLPFNFLIGGDGRVYEGRGWFHQPPAFRRFPDEGCDRIDIGYINNDIKEKVTYQMIRAAADLITLGLSQGYLHTDYQSKEWHRIGQPVVDDPNKPFE